MKNTLLSTLLSVCAILVLFSLTITSQAAEITKYGSSQSVDNNYVSDNEEEQITKKLPTSYNSKDLGFVTSVKNQGNLDTCWAFSSTSSFECLQLINNLFIGDLSVSHMDKWATPDNNNNGWQRQEGEAGFTYIPMGYYTAWKGAVTENDTTPYQGVTSLTYLGKDDTELIKKTIMKSGAVTANLAIKSNAYSTDANSYCLNKSTRNINGHSVSVVGWDDNYSKENFNGQYTPKNDGAWLCKNSWGENVNSIGGYLWVSYEDKYIFDNDTFAPSYGITGFVNISDNINLYQNEEYGATYEFEYLNKESKDITYFNVFDFSENGNVINKVIFETTAIGASYKTFFVPVFDDKPTTDKSCWKQLSNGTVEYAGYICDDVDIVVPKDKGAVAVEVDTSGCGSVNSIGVDEWLTDTEDALVFQDTLKKNSSFVFYNNKLEDIKDVYKEKQNDDVGGNLVIKAVTDETYSIEYGDINRDNTVNITDATALQKALAKINKLDKYQKANADFNKDGIVNILDVAVIQKKIAKIE